MKRYLHCEQLGSSKANDSRAHFFFYYKDPAVVAGFLRIQAGSLLPWAHVWRFRHMPLDNEIDCNTRVCYVLAALGVLDT